MKECSFEHCDHPDFKKTLCAGHYQQCQKGQELRPLSLRLTKTEERPVVCSFPECGRKPYAMALALCKAHYMQQWQGQDLKPLRDRTATKDITLRCTVSGCSRKNYQKNLCRSHWQQQYEGQEFTEIREWVESPSKTCLVYECGRPTNAKGLCFKHRKQSISFGIDPVQFPIWILSAGCEICGDNNRLSRDHDHKCCSTSDANKTCGGCFRGLLCLSCNITLGHMKDDPERLQKLIDYLKKYQMVDSNA